MKGEDLFIALGKIDDRFIEEAAPEKVSLFKKDSFKRLTAIAACICLLVAGYFASTLFQVSDPPVIENYSLHFGSMGYEGTDELSMKSSDDINPWNEDVVLKTLPVYKNLCYNGGELSQKYYSASELRAMAEKLAEKLGINAYDTQLTDSVELYSFCLETQKGSVIVSGRGSSLITADADLVKKHIEIENEKGSGEIRSGDYITYSVDGEPLAKETRSYYEGDSIEESIINFNFRSHYLSEIGGCFNSRREDYLYSAEKLGDYPVISLDKAKSKLISGEYITSADKNNITGGKLCEEVIAKVDLIYYTIGNQELYMPYYRFYVDCYAGGEYKQYAYFYVSAVEEKYLGDYEVFGGDFQ